MSNLNTFNGRYFYVTFFILAMVFSAADAVSADEKVAYLIEMPDPHTHYFEVTMMLSGIEDEYLDVKMPVWTPGSYLIREFARNVEQVVALNKKGDKLNIEKTDKNTWRIRKKEGLIVRIKYKVYAFESSVRTSYLDEEHAFVNGAGVFMFIEGYQHLPTSLKVVPYRKWSVISTSLIEIDSERGLFGAENYSVLIDSPIEIGNQTVLEYTVKSIPHRIAIYGSGNYDEEQLQRDFKIISESATDLFGDNPGENYTFIIHNLNKGSGGLEHLNSCALQVNRWTYQPEGNYHSFLGLVAHEYFHLWWVKRLKPKNFLEIDYNKENYTDLLWVMEGFANYYENIILKKAGIIDERDQLKWMMSSLGSLQNRPGRTVQSVSMSGFDAWIKFYRQNKHSINSQVSYYNKGAVLAALLDLEIIKASKSKYCLDDVVKYLYDQYYKQKEIGITEESLKSAIEKFANKSFDAFFSQYVHGTDEIDYEKYMYNAGIKLIETNEAVNYKSLGIGLEINAGRLTVDWVKTGTSGYKGGIYSGDEILAIDDFRIHSPRSFDFIINQKNLGDIVTLLVAREGLIKRLKIEIDRDTNVHYTYELMDNRSREQEKIYTCWVSRNTQRP